MSDTNDEPRDGVACPACGSMRLRVVCVKDHRGGTLRNRKCKACSHNFNTIEVALVPENAPEPIGEWAQMSRAERLAALTSLEHVTHSVAAARLNTSHRTIRAFRYYYRDILLAPDRGLQPIDEPRRATIAKRLFADVTGFSRPNTGEPHGRLLGGD